MAFGNELPTALNAVVDHELSSLVAWLNELLKLVELNFADHVLLLILDDLHLVKSLKSKSTYLSWFPFSLPSNVHLICSVDERDTALLDVLRTRISADNFVRLPAILSDWSIGERIIRTKLSASYERSLTANQWRCLQEQSTSFPNATMLYLNLLVSNELKHWTSTETKELQEFSARMAAKEAKELIARDGQESPEIVPNSIEQLLNVSLLKLERAFGTKILAKICTYLAYTRYGLREVELIGECFFEINLIKL